MMNVHQENEYLREENRQLKVMLAGPAIEFPREWNLQLAEQRLLRSLYAKAGVRTREVLLHAVAVRNDVEDNLLTVQVSRLRQKLKPLGVEIKNVWNVGYELTPESRAIIKRLAEVTA